MQSKSISDNLDQQLQKSDRDMVKPNSWLQLIHLEFMNTLLEVFQHSWQDVCQTELDNPENKQDTYPVPLKLMGVLALKSRFSSKLKDTNMETGVKSTSRSGLDWIGH